MKQSLTRAVADYVAQPRRELPPDVCQTVLNAFIDTIGVLLAGRDEPVTRAALAFAERRASPLGVRALVGSSRFHAPDAAFVNAVAAHALDFDDMGINGHPSVVLVPTLLALAESGEVSDSEFFSAYVTGYEIWAELASREPDRLHAKGWHPTSVMGTLAATAAAAHLARLDARQAANAIGMAASLAGGLMGNFGSMTKPLHAGWAARHALEAVELAQLGVDARDDVLESDAGYLWAFSPAGRADRSDMQPFKELRIRSSGLSVKKYPIVFAAHRIIDAAIDVRGTGSFDVDDIERIVVGVSEASAKMMRHHAPGSALQAKFSLEFACACALLVGRVGLDEVSDAAVQRADMVALMGKVEIVRPPAALEAGDEQLTIWFRDGSIFESGPLRFPRGHPRNPLMAGELDAKFLGCVPATERSKAVVMLQGLQNAGADDDNAIQKALRRFLRSDELLDSKVE